MHMFNAAYMSASEACMLLLFFVVAILPYKRTIEGGLRCIYWFDNPASFLVLECRRLDYIIRMPLAGPLSPFEDAKKWNS